MWAGCNSLISVKQAMRNLQNFKASTSCLSLQPDTLHLLRWSYSTTERLEESSWLPLSTAAQRVKLMHGDTWWVIALSTRPLVLLTGLVWSFIYTPFCSGFQDNFPSSLQSTNYKAGPSSLGGMLNREKDRWFGGLLQKHTQKKTLNRFSHFGLRVGLVNTLIWAWQLRLTERLRAGALPADRQTGRQAIIQWRWRTNRFDCERGCIFTQVAVCIRGTEPLPKTIIPPLVFCRSRLWHNAIAFIYFIHFSS